MNKIEMKTVQKSEYWTDFEWFIDGVRLSDYLHENKELELPSNVEPFDDLCPAWTKRLDHFGDVRFVWELLEKAKAILPIYMCPDDLDFSCIVIVVEVEKTKDYVYWNKIGLVDEKNYDYSIEKQNGILNTDSYSEGDWEKYGDNIAQAEVDSDEWYQWTGDHWDEELYRRRMNYTKKNYENSENILWFVNANWVFDRNSYETMVADYWEEETLSEIEAYDHKEMSSEDCITIIKKLNKNGVQKLEEHKKDSGEILLHVYAADEIGNPLFELLHNQVENKKVIILCKVVELMWKYGDNSVKNVVDVTLLERLSDDEKVWDRFGRYISKGFIKYINEDLLKSNIAMCGVKPIEI